MADDDVHASNVLAFEPPSPKPKLPPYVPLEHKGTVWVIGAPGDYSVFWYSSSGNAADLFGSYKTLQEAQSHAWRYARRTGAVFHRIDVANEERS